MRPSVPGSVGSCSLNTTQTSALPAHLFGGGYADVPHPRLLLKGLDARLAVVALRRHGGHVGPVEGAQDLGHGLGLVEVRRHGAGKVVVACLVAELGAGGGVADLGDLEEYMLNYI